MGRKQFDFGGTLSRVYKGLGGVRDKPGSSWDRGARFLDGYGKELSASALQLKKIRAPTSLGPAHARLIASVQAQRETYLAMSRILRRKDRPAYEAFIGRSTPDDVTEPAYSWVRIVALRARVEGIALPPWLKAAEDFSKLPGSPGRDAPSR